MGALTSPKTYLGLAVFHAIDDPRHSAGARDPADSTDTRPQLLMTWACHHGIGR